MNCLVCNSICTGYHYRIPSCRACAAFFRRTFNLGLRYRCKGAGNCTVTKRKLFYFLKYILENRFLCKFCRFKRCLAVGMSVDQKIPDISQSFPDSPPILSKLDENDWFSTKFMLENHEEFVIKLKKHIIGILNKV